MEKSNFQHIKNTLNKLKSTYKIHFTKHQKNYIIAIIIILTVVVVSIGIYSIFPNKKIEEYKLYNNIKFQTKGGFQNKDNEEISEEEKKESQTEYDDKNRKNGILEMKRPFLNIYDDKGNRVNVVFVTHPFSRKDCEENYEKGKKEGIQYIGISSYCDFPAIISNPHDAMHDPKHIAWNYNYFDLCKGWCYCFRNPQEFGIPPEYPQILLSESDFAKYNQHKPDTKVKKGYDFLYVCLKDNDKCEDGWQSYNRNWDEAEKCLDIMCNKFHLKGLLIGRINCKVPDSCHQMMETTDFLEYNKFIKMYNKCRFAFVPNKLDASPRVMTEAICFNLPILCNYNITGGWKYITPEVGEYFNKETGDFEKSLAKFLKNFHTYKPREYYMREYPEEKKGKELLDFVVNCVGRDKLSFNPDEVKYLVPGI
jgi:hypothetical protein